MMGLPEWCHSTIHTKDTIRRYQNHSRTGRSSFSERLFKC